MYSHRNDSATGSVGGAFARLTPQRFHALARDFRKEGMTVKLLAFQRDKEVTGLRLPRVRANAADHDIGRTAEQITAAGAQEKLKRERLHECFSSSRRSL